MHDIAKCHGISAGDLHVILTKHIEQRTVCVGRVPYLVIKEQKDNICKIVQNILKLFRDCAKIKLYDLPIVFKQGYVSFSFKENIHQEVGQTKPRSAGHYEILTLFQEGFIVNVLYFLECQSTSCPGFHSNMSLSYLAILHERDIEQC